MKGVRVKAYFGGIIIWGLGEGRFDREGDIFLGCWVIEKDEEFFRER